MTVKRLRDSTNEDRDERNNKVDRIAVVVTGPNIQKIPSIAKSGNGTGLAVSDIVLEHLEARSILELIVAMCTDTTSANTGGSNGACVFLEKKLQRSIIYFACRHHVLELKIGAVFVMLFGDTTGPFTAMFENFKRDWSHIDKSTFKIHSFLKKYQNVNRTPSFFYLQPLDMKLFRKKYLKELKDDAVGYIERVLAARDKRFVSRGDYLEMMQLCLLVLGKTIPGYSFKLPHSCSNARWICGKVIYSL